MITFQLSFHTLRVGWLAGSSCPAGSSQCPRGKARLQRSSWWAAGASSGPSVRRKYCQHQSRHVEHRETRAEPELLTSASPLSGVFLQQLGGENEIAPTVTHCSLPTGPSFPPRLTSAHPNFATEEVASLSVLCCDGTSTIPLVKQVICPDNSLCTFF